VLEFNVVENGLRLAHDDTIRFRLIHKPSGMTISPRVVPLTRRQAYDANKGLETPRLPCLNLPEKGLGRWGQGLMAEKMKECMWVKPQRVAEIEFLQWTSASHLRHTSFVRMR
jgi:hypothetical protein